MQPNDSSVQETFLITKEYRRFAEFCDTCRREKYIGLCHGVAGVGKTLSAHHYARWQFLEPILSAYIMFSGEPIVAAQDCRTLFYTPTVTNTPFQVSRDVRHLQSRLNALIEHCSAAAEGREWNYEPPNYANLLIIDEADRLRFASIEHLRDVYDRSSLGLILIGMPGIEKRLSRYKQLYSRVGFVHEFRTLSKEEVSFILATKWEQFGLTFNPVEFTDVEAMAAIARMTSGNFRLLHRLFSQIRRILEINHLQVITKEVVEAAREGLVLGM